MNRILAALPLLLVAGACARTEDPTYVPVDRNTGYSQVGRVSAPEQDDQEPAIGQWQPTLQDNAPVLVFGPVGAQPLFSLLCTGRQTVRVQRYGGVPGGPLPPLRLSIAGQEAALPVTPTGGSIPLLSAELPLAHPLLQALAQSGQPLIMRFGDDAAPVIIPASPRIGDYLRSCTTAQPIAATPGNSAAPLANAAAPAGNVAAPAPAPPAPAPAATTARNGQ